MFDSYQDIFEQRGELYHQAMVKYPLARKAEFDCAIQWAKLEAGQMLCDIPSGGGYLRSFIDHNIDCNIKLFLIETSPAFMRCAQSHGNETAQLCQDLTQLPLLSNQVDRVISLAGCHHLANPGHFCQEVYRILQPNGIFCLADVRQGSGVDGFLNGFVDQHSSLGHRGQFFTEATAQVLTEIGFDVRQQGAIALPWMFDSLPDAVEFCKLLFGIDQATDAEILAGIEQHLGYEVIDDKYHLNWELYFFQAVKPDLSLD